MTKIEVSDFNLVYKYLGLQDFATKIVVTNDHFQPNLRQNGCSHFSSLLLNFSGKIYVQLTTRVHGSPRYTF